MKSIVIITIKDSQDVIKVQKEIATDEFLEFPTVYNEAPAEWSVFAVSNKFTNDASFKIKEKEQVVTEIRNETILVKNIGNVPYNKSVEVKIGEKTISISPQLSVDEEKTYKLSAPNGDYEVEIKGENSDAVKGSVTLTGKVVSVKEVKGGIGVILKHPLVWLFVLIVLGLTAYICFKKGYQKAFFGYITNLRRKNNSEEAIVSDKSSLFKKSAEISLSLEGEKENASVVCFKIKNIRELIKNRQKAEETLQKFSDLCSGKRVKIYESGEYVFLIFAPSLTKTFKNESSAVELAQRINELFRYHNSVFQQKFNYGISINSGTIVERKEGDVLKFMPLGTLMSNAKKIVNIADEEILLTKEVNEKIMTEVKSEKHTHANTDYYKLKEIRNREKNKNFINDFLKKN